MSFIVSRSAIFRFGMWAACLVGALAGGLLSILISWWWLWLAIPAVGLSVVGLVDYLQPRHSIRRIYPVVGRLRWTAEATRPISLLAAAADYLETRSYEHFAALLRHLGAIDGEEFGAVMRMVTEEVYLDTKARQRPWINESLRRFLYFGVAAELPAGDEGLITGERRKGGLTCLSHHLVEE